MVLLISSCYFWHRSSFLKLYCMFFKCILYSLFNLFLLFLAQVFFPKTLLCVLLRVLQVLFISSYYFLAQFFFPQTLLYVCCFKCSVRSFNLFLLFLVQIFFPQTGFSSLYCRLFQKSLIYVGVLQGLYFTCLLIYFNSCSL